MLTVACGAGEQAAELSGPVAPAAEVGSTTTVVPLSPAVPASPNQPVATPTTARSATTTPVTTARSPSTTTPAATPFRPATAGTYRYDTRGQSSLGGSLTPYPAVTTAIIDPPAGCVPPRTGCTRQHGTRDLRDAAGNGPVFDSTFEYRADGLYLANLRAAATLLGLTVMEELLPPSPVLLLPTGVRPGYHREVDLPTQTSSAHLVIDVLRTERVTVGGQAVDTTVVHLVATLPGPFNARLDLTVWLVPANGLWARELVVAEATPAGLAYRSQYDASLQRLTPA